MLHKLAEEIGRGAAVREATLKKALPHWRELHGAMVEWMRAEGLDTDHRLLDCTNMEKSLREIDAQLTQVRLEGAERVSLEPLPDLEGRSISPRKLAEVEQRLVEEYERPLSKIAATPRPNTCLRPSEDARDAVERQNAPPVSDTEARGYHLAPHESRLDWLDTAQAEAPAKLHREMENRLDWLMPLNRDESSREPDRDVTADESPCISG